MRVKAEYVAKLISFVYIMFDKSVWCMGIWVDVV